jgi:hypothetical protein
MIHDQDLIKMLYLTHNTWGMKSGKDGIINWHMDATSNVILGNDFYFGTLGSIYCVWTLIKMKPSMFFLHCHACPWFAILDVVIT